MCLVFACFSNFNFEAILAMVVCDSIAIVFGKIFKQIYIRNSDAENFWHIISDIWYLLDLYFKSSFILL